MVQSLKERAAAQGKSLSAYVGAELARTAARPTNEEIAARLRARDRSTGRVPARSWPRSSPVIAVDASAMVEALVGRHTADDLLTALAGEIDAPHLLDVEVLSVLRGLVLGGKLDPGDAVSARRDYFAFTITRHETEPLAERIWQLRHQFTAYDASFLVLAEAFTRRAFVTCDAKLATRGHSAAIHLVRPTH